MKGKMKNFAMKAIAGVMAVSMFAMAGCGEALTGDGIGRDPENPPSTGRTRLSARRRGLCPLTRTPGTAFLRITPITPPWKTTRS